MKPVDLGRMRKRHNLPEDATIRTYAGRMRSLVIDRDERIFAGVITNTDLGIDGLIAPASSFDMSYIQHHKSVYKNHDYEKDPIGKWVNLKVQDEAIFSRTFVTKNEEGEKLLTLIEEDIINGLSTGFRSFEESEPTREERKRWGVEDEDAIVVRKALLLEYSVVSMPACPTALIERCLKRGFIKREDLDHFGIDVPRRAQIVVPEPFVVDADDGLIVVDA